MRRSDRGRDPLDLREVRTGDHPSLTGVRPPDATGDEPGVAEHGVDLPPLVGNAPRIEPSGPLRGSRPVLDVRGEQDAGRCQGPGDRGEPEPGQAGVGVGEDALREDQSKRVPKPPAEKSST